jgi:hypothetical protein
LKLLPIEDRVVGVTAVGISRALAPLARRLAIVATCLASVSNRQIRPPITP